VKKNDVYGWGMIKKPNFDGKMIGINGGEGGIRTLERMLLL
jgi:hypothetical protein